MLINKKTIRKNSVTLARALSKLGYCSRSQAVLLIQSGDVQIDGRIEKNPNYWCDLNLDKIELKGTKILKKQFLYIMMNKPKGVVTTRSDELSRTTVYQLLDGVEEWVFPVGRLDKESSGLLLLTNDNQLGERLTSPESKVRKTYQIKLDQLMTEKHQQIMRQGMLLDNEQILPAGIKTNSDKPNEFVVEITIIEGKNRQIRRMCEEFGYTVVELCRTKIGNYDISMLNNKTWKNLSSDEVELLIDKKSKNKDIRTKTQLIKTQNVHPPVAAKKRRKRSYGRMR